MEKDNERDIEQLVAESMASWQMPFDENQPARAKAKIMAIIGEEAQSTVPSKSSSSQLWMRIAAGIAVILAIPIAISLIGNTEVNNSLNEQMAYTLPDGSQITLNPKSSLSFNSILWGLNRDLEFSGEGYFEVSKGSTFNVQTPKGDVNVLGTKFSIWADEDDLTVHCNEGKVKVSNGVDDVFLTEHQFTHHLESGLAPAKGMKHEGFYAPRKNFDSLSFDDVPLSAVIQELELVLEAEIKCSLDIKDLTYSGTINPRELTTCFDVLCKPFGAKHQQNPDGIFEIYE